ncbi:hypothetical protein QN380_25105, partial [Pseudomonas sp. MH10]|nr:hypothetical protein [Pseudomonas sp. MH10]
PMDDRGLKRPFAGKYYMYYLNEETLQKRYLKFTEAVVSDRQDVKILTLRTPLIKLPWLSNSKRTVWAKLECNQLTNSFKVRGGL